MTPETRGDSPGDQHEVAPPGGGINRPEPPVPRDEHQPPSLPSQILEPIALPGRLHIVRHFETIDAAYLSVHKRDILNELLDMVLFFYVVDNRRRPVNLLRPALGLEPKDPKPAAAADFDSRMYYARVAMLQVWRDKGLL